MMGGKCSEYIGVDKLKVEKIIPGKLNSRSLPWQFVRSLSKSPCYVANLLKNSFCLSCKAGKIKLNCTIVKSGEKKKKFHRLGVERKSFEDHVKRLFVLPFWHHKSLSQLQLKAFTKQLSRRYELFFPSELTRRYSHEVINSTNNVVAFVIYSHKIARMKKTTKSFERV